MSDVHGSEPRRADWIRLGVLAAVVLASLLGWWRPFLQRDWLAFAATLAGGFPIFAEAWDNLRRRRMTMELSMTIALVAALCIGQFFTALVIAFFVLFAELLETYTAGGGRRAIQKLVASLPRQVRVRRDGRELELDIAEVGAGETVVIRPGERIPADGRVLKGRSFVDEASITGESLPVAKAEGSTVFAGTINRDGVLEMAVERVGGDTTFGRIIRIVEEAEKSRAPVERIADRLAAGLVYFAFGAALLTLLVTRNVTSTIAVIIVAGACGVAAGTPLAIMAGIGRAARRGIVVKGGLYLEQLARIDTVVLDKTGTLTLGTPAVAEVAVLDGVSADELIRAAATAEQHSEHPLGEAIVRHAQERGLALSPYAAVEVFPGKGIACTEGGRRVLVGTRALMAEKGVALDQAAIDRLAARERAGRTTVLVARDGALLGGILLSDRLRSEARQAIDALEREGYGTVLLTGDSPETARAVGRELGVREAIGGLLPEQKLGRIRERMARGEKVVMVGDGVNDAPALAEATVGVAMGGGTDVALETADVALMTSDLSRLVEVLRIARRCRGVILFNFWGTIGVDSVGIVLAFLGHLTPIAAALIHVGSELAFILNSARLFRRTPGEAG